MAATLRAPRLSGLFEVVAGLGLVGFLLGFLGKFWWRFDLCSHFRVQYAVAFLICAAIFALSRRRKLALFYLLVAAAAGVTLVQPALLHRGSDAVVDGTPFKIISFNVHTENDRHREVLDYLLREKADFVFLMEVDQKWLEDLRELDHEYPFRLKSPRSDNFGLAAFSKLPLSGKGVLEFGPAEIPAMDSRLEVNGTPVRLIGLHTLPPMNADQTRLRNDELFHFADLASNSDASSVLIGDFNITPFSPWFGDILKRSGLRNSATTFLGSPTWMRDVPFFALPIDHALVSKRLAIIDRKVGPSCGSDHNALVLTLGIPSVLQ